MLRCAVCGYRAQKTNSGYYCREFPKGKCALIPAKIAEEALAAKVGMITEPETVIEVIRHSNQQEIERITADIHRMDRRGGTTSKRSAGWQSRCRRSQNPLQPARR